MKTYEQLRLAAGLHGWVSLAETLNPGRRLHRHDELEFNLVTAGRATYIVDGRRHDLVPWTLIWLFPEQDHLLIDHSPDFAMWVAVFAPDLVRAAASDEASRPLRCRRPAGPIRRRVPAAAADELAAVLARVHGSGDTPDLHNAGLGYVLLLAWAAFRDADGITDEPGIDPAVQRAARLLRDESHPVNADALAARVGLSPTRLSRLFRRQTGVSITQYRQRCCLDRFVELYGRGNRLNMTRAALAAGFGSYAQFHRVVKRHFGVGPREYAARVRSAD